MENREFFTNLMEIVKNGAEDIRETRENLKKTEDNISSGKYSSEYVSSTLYPQATDLRKRIGRISDEATAKAGKLIADYAAEIRASDALHPGDLTDDVKLLAPGIVLTRNDLVAMLARNEGNATMLQVILRYAKENGFDNLGVRYDGSEEMARQVEGLDYTVGLVLRRAVEGVDMYARLMGEGSAAFNAFCV